MRRVERMSPEEIRKSPMPAPLDVRKKFALRFAAAVETLVDEIWDEATKAALADAGAKVQQFFFTAAPAGRDSPEPEPVNPNAPIAGRLQGRLVYDHPTSIAAMSPQKRGAQNRERKGVVKSAIREIIYNNPHGITRAGIRLAAHATRGLTIKDGSLRQGLRLLSKAKEIENRDHMWFPTENGGP
jgi:hypothetical protein